MNDAPKHALTPKLRFPEFKDRPWVPKRLEDVAPLQRGFDLPSDELRPGKIPVVYSNGIQSFHSTGMARGPGLVTGRSGTIGRLHFIEDGEYWPHNTSLWVTSFNGNDPKFVYYLYDSIGMGRFATGSGVPTLNRNDVHTFQTSVPREDAEQRRIAACLTSLDELLAAEGRKLKALQTHKKGLMQQLFPREGESRPALRFPEFREAGQWKTRKISSILSKQSAAATLDADVMYREIGVRSHGKGLFHKEPVMGNAIGDKRVFHVVPDALVINIVFAWEQALAVTTPEEVGFIASHRFPMFVPKDNQCDVSFMQRLFLTPLGKELLKVASPGGAGRNRTLSQKEFENLDVRIPETAEQQRIASCLASQDTLIATASRKIDCLRAHKKGLMQQLFPSPERG